MQFGMQFHSTYFGNVSAGISCKLKTGIMRTVYNGMLVCYSEHSTSALFIVEL